MGFQTGNGSLTTKLESDIMKYIFTVYYTYGASNPKIPQKRFVNTASAKEKKRFFKSKTDSIQVKNGFESHFMFIVSFWAKIIMPKTVHTLLKLITIILIFAAPTNNICICSLC